MGTGGVNVGSLGRRKRAIVRLGSSRRVRSGALTEGELP